MKKLIQMLGMLLLLNGLAACTVSEEKTKETNKEVSTKSPSALPPSKEMGTAINKAELEKISRYHTDLISGNQAYRLYFFSNDETSWIQQDATLHDEEGDIMHSGTYQVALGLRGDQTYYVQDQMNLMGGKKMSWNSTNPYVEKISDRLLAIYQPETTNTKVGILLTVEDGQVMDLTDNGLLLSGSFKQIDESTFQTYLYSNSEPAFGWSFYTYKLNENKLKLVDKIEYYGETIDLSYEQGKILAEKWKENENFFIPYKDLSVDSSWLKEAAKGRLVGVSYPLGTDIQTIQENNPQVINKGSINGEPYFQYPTETYSYNETTEKTTVLAISGKRIGVTLQHFKENVGIPDSEGTSADEFYLRYRTGENDFWVYGNPETGQIENISLHAPKE